MFHFVYDIEFVSQSSFQAKSYYQYFTFLQCILVVFTNCQLVNTIIMSTIERTIRESHWDGIDSNSDRYYVIIVASEMLVEQVKVKVIV